MTMLLKGSEPALRLAGFGFLFWAAFLLTLMPGTVVHALETGTALAVDQEAVRIMSASMLGSVSAVLQFALLRRFPLAGRGRPANLAIHVLACLGLSLLMNVLAALFAPFVLAANNPRLARPLGDQIARDSLLVAFALGAFLLLLHLRIEQAQLRPAAQAPAPGGAAHIPVQTRDGVVLVEAEAIDWVEAQGNYAALHAGRETHLVRETLTRLSQRLGAERFVRVHRGAIVNVSRLKRMKSLASGDALLELADGTELRASRTFAGTLREKLRS